MTDLHPALAALAEAARHPHKGPNDTDTSMLLAAAQRLDGGYEPGGSHTRQTVARVLRAVVDLLAPAGPAAASDAEPADGPACETCGRTTCPDADLPGFSAPRDCEYAPIYQAIHDAKDCDYGCARDLTNQGIRLYIVPVVEQLKAAAVDGAVAAALIVGATRTQRESTEWPPRVNTALTVGGHDGAIVRTVEALVPHGHFRVTLDVPPTTGADEAHDAARRSSHSTAPDENTTTAVPTAPTEGDPS